ESADRAEPGRVVGRAGQPIAQQVAPRQRVAHRGAIAQGVLDLVTAAQPGVHRQAPGAGSIDTPRAPGLRPSSRTSGKVWTCSAFSSATSLGPVQMIARPEVCASIMSR